MAPLDHEEKEIINSLQKGEWKSVRNLKGEIRRFKKYAKSTIKKNKRVNIRLSNYDLEGIQRRAIEEGIPYQTLMASVIHKFVTGHLVERRDIMR